VWRVRVIAKYNIPLAGQQAWLDRRISCEYSPRPGGVPACPRTQTIHTYVHTYVNALARL